MLRRSQVAALHDIIMAAISIVFAMYLRLGDSFTMDYPFLPETVFLFTGVCAVVFYLMGLYKGIWRYASIMDLMLITKAITLATVVFIPFLFMITRLDEFPRSVLVINWLLLLIMLGGPRIIYRMVKDQNFSLDLLKDRSKDERIPVLLIGISDNAVNFIRESANIDTSNYRVVAIIDEEKSCKNRCIHRIKVYGCLDDIPKIMVKLKRENLSPRRLILTSNYMDKLGSDKVLKISEEFGLKLAKLPRMSDFKDASSDKRLEVKPVAIEDLLGRAQKTPSLGRRKELIEGKVIMVTGAGGTIGSELVRQIASYSPSKIILLEMSEFNLYQIDKEVDEKFSGIRKHALISDIRDADGLEVAFNKYKPEIVFHAAALKHVPIVEENLSEAALTNIIGTKNIANMCLKYKADKMVMISTDKAVNPTSLMGTTKRMAECYVQCLGESEQNSHTSFSMVRFGNVLGSSGSVIPLFQRQLEQGGPITVTDPKMVRYFMTIPEAVELVLQASTLATEDISYVFVLDMGEPVVIKDMAIQMIKLAGLRPDIDIEIKYTGVRPGEKLYEELFYSGEENAPTIYDGIMQAESQKHDYKKMTKLLDYIYKTAKSRDEKKLLEIIKEAVPEYKG